MASKASPKSLNIRVIHLASLWSFTRRSGRKHADQPDLDRFTATEDPTRGGRLSGVPQVNPPILDQVPSVVGPPSPATGTFGTGLAGASFEPVSVLGGILGHGAVDLGGDLNSVDNLSER